ncbi:MAG: hypothetical protein ACI9YT_003173 [Halobacteriales archaeon]|jgi:hypothetical protein
MGKEEPSSAGGWADPFVGVGDVVLLYDDLPDDVEGHYCERALTVGPADERAELLVRFTDADAPRIGMGARHNQRQPAKRGVVLVGDGMEARTLARDTPDFDDPLVMDAVLDPANLKALGTSISRFCQAWADEGRRITVCFDSLSDVLGAVDPEAAFRFVRVLAGRFEGTGATAHVHVGPDGHDEAILEAFEDALDGVLVEFEADDRAVDVAMESSRALDAEIADALDDR